MTTPARVAWTRAGVVCARPCAGPAGSAEARERGDELRRVDRAPAAGQVIAGPNPWATSAVMMAGLSASGRSAIAARSKG